MRIKHIVVAIPLLLICIAFMFYFSLGPFSTNYVDYSLPINLTQNDFEKSERISIDKESGFDFSISFKRKLTYTKEEFREYAKIVIDEPSTPVTIQIILKNDRGQIIYEKTSVVESNNGSTIDSMKIGNNRYTFDNHYIGNINPLASGNYLVTIRIIKGSEKFKGIDCYLRINNGNRKV